MRKLVLLSIHFLIPAVFCLGQPEFIAISKSGPPNAIPGRLISYKISVGNGDQNDWTGTVTDVLPDEFTYYSSDPEADNITGQTLKWINFTVPAGENRVILVTGYAGKPGSTFADPRYPDGYYMLNSNVVTAITNNTSLEYGTSGATLSATYSTDVAQQCDFYFEPIIGQIKMATNSTFKYLVVIQNLGNVWDRYSLYVNPDNPEYKSCINPDGTSSTNNEKLYNQILDLNNNPLSTTPWVAPKKTYSFYLKLTTPTGTAANRWNCTDLIATSEICDKVQTKTFHTETVNPTNEAKIYLFQIDNPDPIGCYDTLSYSIYATNIGINTAYNTVIKENYNSFVEFISADPPPDTGTDNIWTLGQIPTSTYALIEVKVKIKPGVYDQQQLTNEVVVNYENDAQNPALYTQKAYATTTVNAYPDLVIEKSAYPGTLKLGDTITYTLNYYNVGCGIATGVKIVDKYDAAHTIVINNEGGNVANGEITWDIGEVSPQDGTLSLSYRLKVTDVSCGAVQVQNEVSLSSLEPDQNILNNSASISLLATTSPTWTRFPANVSVRCDSVPDIAIIGESDDVWAVDACGRDVTITYGGEIKTTGNCTDTYTLTRTWKAQDEFGNYVERSQVIAVSDNIPPDITCPSFNGYNISIDEFNHVSVFIEANSGENYIISGTDFDAGNSDNCDTSPLMSYTLSGSTSGSGSSVDGVNISKGVTTVTWKAVDRCGNENTCTYSIVVNADPSISLSKGLLNINDDPEIFEYFAVDNTLKYSFRIQNTGNVTLYNVSVTDPTANLTGSPVTLAPGAIDSTTYTATYTIKQNDIDAGILNNVATATGKTIGDLNTEVSDNFAVLALQTGGLTLNKMLTTTPASYDQTGDMLTYDLVITNTGNVTLTDVSVTDNKATIAAGAIGTLAPGASVTIYASHSIAQSDIDAGRIDNIASVSGIYHDGSNIGYTVVASDTVSVLAVQNGGVTLDKISADSSYDQPGDILAYDLVITNTGNVTLTDVTVTDTIASVSGSPVASLAPGASVTISASHIVTQADIDAGRLENTASVSGLYYDGGNIEHTVYASDTASVQAIQTGEITLDKISPVSTYDKTGDILTYDLVITNTGNVTLLDLIVTDSLAIVSQGSVAKLAPGASVTISASHTVSQSDIDNGELINTASVKALYKDYLDNEHEVKATGTKGIKAFHIPILTIISTASHAIYNTPGDGITYTSIITNTGNVTISDITVINDLTEDQLAISYLQPGESDTLITTYIITQDDLEAGELNNSISVNGLCPDKSTVTYSNEVTILAFQPFALKVNVTTSDDYAAINDTVVFNIFLESSSMVNIYNVLVTDIMPAHSAFLNASFGGAYDESTNTVKWSIDFIRPDEIIQLDLAVIINNDTEHKTVIENIALAESDQTGKVYSNHTMISVVRFPLIILATYTNAACYNESSGSATVKVYGGVLPYKFTWDTEPVQDGSTANNLPAGIYKVSVEDAMGYTDDLSVTIAQPSAALNATPFVTNVLCYGESTGSVNLIVTGGTSPYAYQWSNNATTQNINELPKGEYSVSVTDSLNCSMTLGTFVDEPSESLKVLNVNIEGVLCIDDPFGSIKFDASGGVPPYKYLWNTNHTTMNLDNITGGDYDVTITDMNGCRLSQKFLVDYKYTDCKIRVPGGLTPYGQFDNILIIKGLEKYPNNNFKIFNRYGSQVFEAAPYKNDWDGVPNFGNNITESDGRLPSGTYFYILELEPGKDPLSGYIYLIKN